MNEGARRLAGEKMRLYLVQHGEALPEQIDPARPLSDKGRADLEKIGEFLKENKISIPQIWHSTKLRSKQTAEILKKPVAAKILSEKSDLAPNDSIDNIFNEISLEVVDLLITSHLPFLSKLASRLLGNLETAGLISFRQGGVVCLEKDPNGQWQITWIVVPGLLKQRGS